MGSSPTCVSSSSAPRAVLAFLVFRVHWPGPLWLLPAVIAFAALVLVHEPMRRRGQRAKRTIGFYENGLARLDDRWAGTGDEGLDFQDLNHPYAADLDLFGKGSLFERLCTARTRAGQETLARWLLEPADIKTLRDRHQAVIELRPRLDLREDLELLGSDVRSGIDPQALSDWGKAPRLLQSRALRVAAFVLAAVGISAVIGWAFFETGIQPMLAVFSAEAAFAIALSSRVRRVLEAVAERSHDLVLLGELLDRIECESCTSPLLVRLRQAIEADGRPASVQIRRLARWVHLLQTEKNQFFTPLAAVLMWRTQIAIVIDGWRGAEGPAIAGWLSAVGQFEALTALAAYAAENPGDPFPEIEPGDGRFEAEGLGHPLIPVSECVPNDVSLGGSVRALVVSGSNMSGKSTLLRSGRGLGAGPVWGPGPCPSVANLTPCPGRNAAYPGLTPGRQIAVLCRDHSGASGCRPVGRPAALTLSLRRALSRHELARPPHRCRIRLAWSARAGSDRIGHDARPGAGGDRHRPGFSGPQRPLRGSILKRPDALRLQDASGRRRALQRAGADACGGAGGLTAPPSVSAIPTYGPPLGPAGSVRAADLAALHELITAGEMWYHISYPEGTKQACQTVEVPCHARGDTIR